MNLCLFYFLLQNELDQINIRSLNENIEQMTTEMHKYKLENEEFKLENSKLLADVAAKKENLQLLQFKMLQIQEKCQVSRFKLLAERANDIKNVYLTEFRSYKRKTRR